MRKYFFVYAEIYFLAEEIFSPCGRRKIFVPTQGNFYAHENKFSCARKYFFVRIEIWRLAHGREFPLGRERISLGKRRCCLGERETKEGEGLYLGRTPRGASLPL